MRYCYWRHYGELVSATDCECALLDTLHDNRPPNSWADERANAILYEFRLHGAIHSTPMDSHPFYITIFHLCNRLRGGSEFPLQVCILPTAVERAFLAGKVDFTVLHLRTLLVSLNTFPPIFEYDLCATPFESSRQFSISETAWFVFQEKLLHFFL